MFFGLSLLVGCGDDERPLIFGTCDESERNGSCRELSTYAETEFMDQREFCNGRWTNDPCPVTADLIGCCKRPFQIGIGRIVECFYPLWNENDPALNCVENRMGTWTPGARPPR